MQKRQVFEVIAVDTRTGEERLFPSAKAASDALGLGVNKIHRYMRGDVKRKPKHHYIFRRGNPNDTARGYRRPVVRINPETGEKTFYDSIASAARENYICQWAIWRVLRGDGKKSCNHYWQYADERKEGDN